MEQLPCGHAGANAVFFQISISILGADFVIESHDVRVYICEVGVLSGR